MEGEIELYNISFLILKVELHFKHPGEIKSVKENIIHGFNLMLFTFEKCILPIFKTDESG